MLNRRLLPGKMRPSVFLRMFGILVFAFGMSVAQARIIDLNHNGMSDIWEWIYNAYGISPTTDPDGDTFNNLQESIADTDPFNSNSYPYIPTFTNSSSNFSVTFPCVVGKLYQLQGLTAIGATNWVVEASVV